MEIAAGASCSQDLVTAEGGEVFGTRVGSEDFDRLQHYVSELTCSDCRRSPPSKAALQEE